MNQALGKNSLGELLGPCLLSCISTSVVYQFLKADNVVVSSECIPSQVSSRMCTENDQLEEQIFVIRQDRTLGLIAPL